MRRLLSRLLRRGGSLLLLTGLASLLLLGGAGPASAHSDLEGASPGPGDDVAVGASAVHLEFGEAVVVDDRNQVTVEDASGDPVAVGAPSVVDDGLGVCSSLDSLDAGEYVLDWRLVSVDDHLVQSRYSFEVSDAGEPADEAACSGVELASPELPDEGFSLGTGAIVGIGVVALLLAVGAFAWRVRADRRET